MGSFTADGKKHILDNGLGTMFAALHTAAPAAGNEFDAPRIEIDSWTTAKSGANATAKPAAAVQFRGTSGSDIGRTPSHMALWSASTGGTIFATDALTLSGGGNPGALTNGQVPSFAADDLDFTLT